jgi:hypothetical protein
LYKKRLLFKKILLTACCISYSVFTEAQTADAFPGAEGFGRYTSGGRGGRVMKVTNLNDAGEGSLRAAVEAKGARIVMFEVSGNIELRSKLYFLNDSITIAGQTAPGDGVTITNYPVLVKANNVIIRFVRFRMGDEAKEEGDPLGGTLQKNILIDHCSMSWSTDECLSFYNNDSLTVQWCIIAESLRGSVHFKGAHGYGAIWGGKYASFHHNLLAHHDSRNPRLGERAGSAYALTDLTDMRNNVIYNWGHNSTYGAEAMNVNIVNNYYKPGPASINRGRIFSPDKNKFPDKAVYNTWGKFYIDGNVVEGSEASTKDNWQYGVYKHFHSSYGVVTDSERTNMRMQEPHPVQNNITTYTAVKAFDQVIGFAGASLKRDAVDKRIVQETINGTFSTTGSKGSKKGIIDSHRDAGGWPVLQSLPALKDTDGDGMPDEWEIKNKLDPFKPNANGRDLSSVYDNIEMYINSLVKDITDRQWL